MRYITSKDIRIKNPFKNFSGFLTIAAKSCKKSKTNFFFQSINCFAILLLLILILPERIDQYLDQWNNIRIFYSYLPKIGIAIFLFFVGYILTVVTNLKWEMLFRTKLRDSIKLLVGLVFLMNLLYCKTSYIIWRKYHH